MKITGYRTIRTHRDWGRPVGDVNGYIASGVTEVTLVVVETDEGVEGIGVGSDHDIARIFPALEGQDPRAVSALYDRMLAHVFKAGHNGATFGGIAILDAALWDIKAKLAGEPLWRLLGAGDRFVPGYASGLDIALGDEELAELYRAFADRGFTSGKLKGGRDVETDLRRLRIVRDALGAGNSRPALMLDANESWNLKQAVRYVTAIEAELDLTWIEEPLRRWDAHGHARLSQSVNAAVATGENLTGLEQFRALFDLGGVDIVQTGAVWGITHFLRLAHAAHARDLPISPVGLTSNPAVAHAAAAVPNHLTAEVQDLRGPFGVTIDEEFVDGGILLGTRPGAGVTIDEALIASRDHEGDWLQAAGPHVRPARAGLGLGAKPSRGNTVDA
ncbi:mandelate racemase/muconate lactonizing enzyme family protein [Microbacterium sp. SORGH_AS_0888]|uniref:mandelate racemase/muconate lactonizing enzyme family protein n=1 Tax=Microbacterium sp. SORGH_AS_0888 TaxID=3041791 RepID=UPI0027813121|nr:mandelate racemase/muconate lactonizing enzyme family protein [Microbacterium sp. SORGH_AS_0888]MDQ1130294.1 L-alanine-DL-glutamate epimerase-like enolase superfamily enzyme [Microbacterium sp. SORGH_AS_0888]